MSKSTLKDQCQEPRLRITIVKETSQKMMRKPVEETSQNHLTFRCYFLFLAHELFHGDLVWRFHVVILSRMIFMW